MSVQAFDSVLEKIIEGMPDELSIVFFMRNKIQLSLEATSKALGISINEIAQKEKLILAFISNKIQQYYETSKLYEFHLKHCDAMVKRVMNSIKEL
ncbi:MAG TPA: hypothetical protein PKX92_01075 [Edaphocola sp.]|nr:hypothetical protein [Edaphocola sp.]